MGLGVLAFILALVVSIMLHEAGHLLTAKHYGMKATQYFLGFGPTLFSFRRGETEYGVKAIPAGGFVKIVGMTQLEELDPKDEPRAFWRQRAGQRTVVLAAGSVTHFVLAVILIFITLTLVGLPGISTKVEVVSTCVTKDEDKDCTAADPVAPARAAGLQPGDRVLAFEGKRVEDWVDDFSTRVRAHPGGPATLVIERDGRELTLRPVVALALRDDPDRPGQKKEVGQLGVRPAEENRRYGPIAAVRKTASGTKDAFVLTFKGIAALPAAVPKGFSQAFTGKERTADGIVSPVGLGRVSGQAIAEGAFSEFLIIVAGFNIFIGVMNLLPLLPLDGGHLAVLGYEEARSWWARRRGRRDPGRVDIRKLMPVAQLVIILFASLFFVALYADIANPLANPFSPG